MKTKIIYIICKGHGYTETIDEFPYNNKKEQEEAWRCLQEYKISDPAGKYYFSLKPCKD